MGEVYSKMKAVKGTVATYVPVVKQVTYQQIVLPSSIPVIRSDIDTKHLTYHEKKKLFDTMQNEDGAGV